MRLNLKNRNRNLTIILALIFALYLVVLVLTPRPIDWSLSFSKDDNIPYGTEILFKELRCLYDPAYINVNNRPLFNLYDDPVVENADFIFINKVFKPSDLDLDSLLTIVHKGSDAFISAIEFNEVFKDTLGFDVKEATDFTSSMDSLIINFTNAALKTDSGYIYRKAFHKVVFTKLDSLNTVILGVNKNNEALFVKLAFGEGNFYLHTNPLSFTNYALLQNDNNECAFKALSYLRSDNVVWDEYYKDKARPANSVVRYILSQPALRFGWYILLFGVVVYLIFGAKRKQRAIPVVMPPVNTSLSFVNTIGRLYLKRQNHLDIAQKKYSYFMFYLRTKCYIDTSLSEDMLKYEIAEKLDVPDRVLNKLFSLVKRLNMNVDYTEDDLMELSRIIEFIYNIISVRQ